MGDRFIRQLGEQMLTNATAQAQGGVLGMIFGKASDKRQLKQQGKLQALQIAGNKEMTDYQAKKELEMWKATNYGPQVEQLKAAGLNPALIYGMGGGGGTTTGGSGGGVSGGQAVHGTEEVTMAGMGMQLGLMQAQKKVLESQANLNNVEASKKEGVDTDEAKTRIVSLTQGINNAKAVELLTKVQTRIAEVEAEIKGKSANDAIDYIAWQTGKALEEMHQAENETFIQRATMNSKIDLVKAEMLGAFLRNELTKAQTEKTQAETTKIGVETRLTEQQIITLANKVVQDWRSLEIQGQNADTHKRQMIDDVTKETNLPYNIAEMAIDAIILKNVLGNKQTHTPVKGFHER